MIILRWGDKDTSFNWLDIDLFYIKPYNNKFYPMAKVLNILSPMNIIIDNEILAFDYLDMAETFVRDFNEILDFRVKQNAKKELMNFREKRREGEII